MVARPVLVLAVLAACHQAPVPAPKAEPVTTVTPIAPVVAAGPSYGEACGADDACAAGLTCEKYYGIAGASGPRFATCEMRCDDDARCTAGRRCGTVADGPGRVCR